MQQEKTIEGESQISWEQVRENFPVTKRMAYLNSAGAGPVPLVALEAAAQFYQETLESGDRRWEVWLARREQARAHIARLINAEPDEIGLTTNTSSGMNLIVDALEGSGEVISSDLEFPVSTIPWMHRNMRVRLVKAIEGEIRMDDLKNAMDDKTAIICLSHVQYSNGFRSDLNEIGNHKGNHTLVVNASQSAGVFTIDVKRMKIDALCATGHKWMLAGYGSGFVYLSRELLERTRPRGISWMSVEDPFAMRNDSFNARRDAAARAETGCPHFAGIFALGAATRYMLEISTEQIERRALAINRHLTESLTRAGWPVLSPLVKEAWRSAETLVGIEDPQHAVKHLAHCGVAVTIKSQGFRAATHFFNNEDDVARLIEALDELRSAKYLG